MEVIDSAVAFAPKAGFREKKDSKSETIPQAGRIRM
jgi:hypothetical protein